MSTKCTFYRCGKRMNSTMRPERDGQTWDISCDFFEPFDILAPEILLRDEGLSAALRPPQALHVMDYNYVYIEAPIDRYYFINKWTRINGIWHATTTEDTLGTWRNTILESEQYVLRCGQSSNWDNTIQDTIYNYKLSPYSSASAAFSLSSTGFNYRGTINHSEIIGRRLNAVINACELTSNVNGTLTSTNDSYLYYNFDGSAMGKLLQKIKYGDSEKANLQSYISRLYYLPVEPTQNQFYQDLFQYGKATSNQIHHIKCGFYADATKNENEDVTWIAINTAGAAEPAYAYKTLATTTLVWSVNIPDKSPVAFENGSQYTQMYIKFYPFGDISIDPNLFIGVDTIHLYQTICFTTGDSVLYIDTGAGRKQLACANIAIDLPISSIISNGNQYQRQVVQANANVGSAILNDINESVMSSFSGAQSGGVAGAVVGGIGAGISGLESVSNSIINRVLMPNVQSNPSIQGVSGNMLDDYPLLIVQRYSLVGRDDARFGRPCCQRLTLGSQLTGATAANNYTITNPGLVVCQCAAIKSGTDAIIGTGLLAAERAAIENALNGGVYLE